MAFTRARGPLAARARVRGHPGGLPLDGPRRPGAAWTASIVMASSTDHLDLMTPPVRVCIEVDLSWWPAGGRLKIGARRSPIRTPEQAAALAREIVRRDGFELAGIMGYEAHIAGVGDRPLGKPLHAARDQGDQAALGARAGRAAGRRGGRGARGGADRARERRRHRQPRDARRAEAAVTEVTAGSGFYAPTLFDRYDDLRAAARGDVRPAGRAAARPRGGHRARRRLPRLRGGGPRPAAGALPARRAAARPAARAPARCRRP